MRWKKLSRPAHERGFTLIELLIVMVIMGVVTTAVTTLFVTGSNAELDMNNRFQAQVNARLALDKVRREIHCANVATPTGSSTPGATAGSASARTTGNRAARPSTQLWPSTSRAAGRARFWSWATTSTPRPG